MSSTSMLDFSCISTRDGYPVANSSQFESTADCTLYTIGSCDVKMQVCPPYFFQLAQENREKSYAMVHWDPNFYYTNTFGELDWKKINVDTYQHKKFTNVVARLMTNLFPETSREFEQAVLERLEKGGEVFLGVHNECWIDSHCMGDTYNRFREKYKGKIHFYIQSGQIDLFLYKGTYTPLTGLFARHIFYNVPPYWSSLQRYFAPRSTPSEKESLYTLALEFLRKNHYNFPYYEFCNYFNKPESHRLIMTPLENLSSEMFYKDFEPLSPSLIYRINRCSKVTSIIAAQVALTLFYLILVHNER